VPGHTDKIDQAFADRVTGVGDVSNPGGVHDGRPTSRLTRAAKSKKGAVGWLIDGRNCASKMIAVDRTLQHAVEVQALRREHQRSLDTIVRGQASGSVLVHDHPHADDKIRAHRSTDSADKATWEGDAILQ
jgi:hypothetical protein